jgi:hypothetical protein
LHEPGAKRRIELNPPCLPEPVINQMKSDAMEAWFKRKKTSGAIGRKLVGIGAVLAGIAVLFLTFWFTYAIIWFGFQGVTALSELTIGKRLHLTHEWRLVGSGIFIVLLFIQHVRTSPWYWGEYPQRDYVSAPGLQARAGALGALGFMLTYPGASANMIADILLSGPRLVTGGWNLWQESRRLAHLDEEVCSQFLTFLASRPGVVPYDELRTAGWEQWFGQLRSIEGIVFLEKGLNLSSELRQELSKLKASQSHAPV